MSVVSGPSNLGILVVSSSVNTEQNCWLRISALCLLSECSWPSCNKPKEETPHLSWRCDFSDGIEINISRNCHLLFVSHKNVILLTIMVIA